MQNVAVIRFAFFTGILALMVLWEIIAPKRTVPPDRKRRWPANLGISALNTVVASLAVPVAPVLFAAIARDRGWGLLNNVEIHEFVSIIAGIVALDFVIYLQHLMFHSVPILWRLHMVHHSDLHIDATTGLRFHPVEILVSLGIKLAAVALLGPPAVSVLAFEIILNGTSLFNHGNVRIPACADRIIRALLVTPDMHRVHHSVAIRETNSNFGFNLSWWDRLMGTYRAEPAAGHGAMVIGMATRRKPVGLLGMLVFPATGDPGRYAIGGHGSEPRKTTE